MSASVRASAMASLPEISISLSSSAAGACPARVAVVIGLSPLRQALLVGVFSGNPRGDRHPAHLPLPSRQLLLVLPPVAEAVRADSVYLVPDLGLEPRAVGALVLPPH